MHFYWFYFISAVIKCYNVCFVSVHCVNRRPWVCGVSSLGIDHTQILGDTIEKIAWQKGGIFKVCWLYTSVMWHCDWTKSEMILGSLTSFNHVNVYVFLAWGSCLHSQTARRCDGCAQRPSQRDKSESDSDIAW